MLTLMKGTLKISRDDYGLSTHRAIDNPKCTGERAGGLKGIWTGPRPDSPPPLPPRFHYPEPCHNCSYVSEMSVEFEALLTVSRRRAPTLVRCDRKSLICKNNLDIPLAPDMSQDEINQWRYLHNLRSARAAHLRQREQTRLRDQSRLADASGHASGSGSAQASSEMAAEVPQEAEELRVPKITPLEIPLGPDGFDHLAHWDYMMSKKEERDQVREVMGEDCVSSP